MGVLLFERYLYAFSCDHVKNKCNDVLIQILLKVQ